jgi:hypothetical protein
MKKKTLVGWIEPNYLTQWNKGFPFKLWKKEEAEEGDIKVRITIEEIK